MPKALSLEIALRGTVAQEIYHHFARLVGCSLQHDRRREREGERRERERERERERQRESERERERERERRERLKGNDSCSLLTHCIDGCCFPLDPFIGGGRLALKPVSSDLHESSPVWQQFHTKPRTLKGRVDARLKLAVHAGRPLLNTSTSIDISVTTPRGRNVCT